MTFRQERMVLKAHPCPQEKKHMCGDPRIRVIPLSTETSLHLQGLSQPIHLYARAYNF